MKNLFQGDFSDPGFYSPVKHRRVKSCSAKTEAGPVFKMTDLCSVETFQHGIPSARPIWVLALGGIWGLDVPLDPIRDYRDAWKDVTMKPMVAPEDNTRGKQAYIDLVINR